MARSKKIGSAVMQLARDRDGSGDYSIGTSLVLECGYWMGACLRTRGDRAKRLFPNLRRVGKHPIDVRVTITRVKGKR